MDAIGSWTFGPDDGVPPPVGSFAHATAAGESLHVTGQMPTGLDGELIAGGIVEQTDQVMRNLATTLKGAGASLTDVVKTTVYVASTRQQDLVTAWNIYRDYMGSHDVPSTLLGVTVLGYANQLVEVEAVAVLPQAAEPGRVT